MNPGEGSGHRCEIAHQVRRDSGIRERPLGPADVRWSGLVPAHLCALCRDLHGIENRTDAREPRVRYKNFLVGIAFDLESLRRKSHRGERDHVVSVARWKSHGEPAVLVSARCAADVTGDRCHSDGDVLYCGAVGTGYPAQDDVGLLRLQVTRGHHWNQCCGNNEKETTNFHGSR